MLTKFNSPKLEFIYYFILNTKRISFDLVLYWLDEEVLHKMSKLDMPCCLHANSGVYKPWVQALTSHSLSKSQVHKDAGRSFFL